MRREISFLIAMAALMKKKLIPQSCRNVNLQEGCSQVYLDRRCWLNGSPYSEGTGKHSQRFCRDTRPGFRTLHDPGASEERRELETSWRTPDKLGRCVSFSEQMRWKAAANPSRFWNKLGNSVSHVTACTALGHNAASFPVPNHLKATSKIQ